MLESGYILKICVFVGLFEDIHNLYSINTPLKDLTNLQDADEDADAPWHNYQPFWDVKSLYGH